MNQEKIILGIDPGTILLGYGLIRISGKQLFLIEMGVLKLQKIPDHFERLARIFQRINALIVEFTPDEVAIEAPFFGKNIQSMLKLGRAQGVALAPAFNRGIPVFEYSPRKIKQSITGNGNASKEQVAMMVQNILKFTETPEYLDATDGIAAALCHYYQSGQPTGGAGVKSWEEYIRKNPDKVR
ncbi:MAG: crossover junction endodeoxyribonuclease RuvC [Bacteroidales bacterium]|jgi:crossover junction endodeoxyribonuclease RuvC